MVHSRHSSVAVMSRGGSAVPTSQGNSTAPIPRAHGGVSTASKGPMLTSPVRLRASQIAQRAYSSQPRPPSGTRPIQDLGISQPLPYDYGSDEDEFDDDHNDTRYRFPDSHREPGIDEVSPDEDDRAALAALHSKGMFTSFIKRFTDISSGLGSRVSLDTMDFEEEHGRNDGLYDDDTLSGMYSSFIRFPSNGSNSR